MSDNYFDLEERNRQYQRDLAKALITTLGSEGAYDTCEINGWQGVCTCSVGIIPETTQTMEATDELDCARRLYQR